LLSHDALLFAVLSLLFQIRASTASDDIVVADTPPHSQEYSPVADTINLNIAVAEVMVQFIVQPAPEGKDGAVGDLSMYQHPSKPPICLHRFSFALDCSSHMGFQPTSGTLVTVWIFLTI